MSTQKIAVLCVSKNSIYKSFKNCECYDIDRDMRTFDKSCPIVAHPPCGAWSAFCSHQSNASFQEKQLAPLCVDILKECGGVLEHPAHSKLWKYCDLPKPGQPPKDGLWSIEVKQAWWGDCRSKNTWLLLHKITDFYIPIRFHDPKQDTEQWNKLSKSQRAATPKEFAIWLVNLARKVNFPT